jgi:hypothetical protein
MKHKMFSVISLLTLASVLAVGSSRAEETPKEKPVGKRTMAKYDADKDGKLSDAEKAAWEADKAKAREQRKAKKAAEKGDGAKGESE